ncbi:TPA: hypothetical protein L6B08_16025 [Pseudomonas aeruginosa]|uniref:Transmembrane protein n=1 Tax=Pseudomonas paraeruginosa (strain DSM 24068 / PA7) TaxID=381754 RepID=A6VA52_PSEP7|nr:MULTISPECIES: hypothetical protein [Pseudomonas aeruginosa group]ABR82726.1 hypothetical protein PSPA7_4590 [Pseudomonas aeruginosa PA7]KSC53179.1 hypothetical protein AO882_02530 [Pseudomonas paraeruginosa]KSC92879.1 hypothetical protein AO896_05840 [Pseudomonas aeruginosa]KSD26878.1 hypothetical protein AO898_04965 [Pseudomonas aeruginosa]KSG59561.1 hypothetical protein AO955_06595 [Pseudomonas aeruginosa]
MIQAGFQVGFGVVLGVAAGWWLGDWEQALQVKDSVARLDCLLYGALLVTLLRRGGLPRRLGLLGVGLFFGALLVYALNPAGLFTASESWSLARVSMRAFGPLVMLAVGMACARLVYELR